jgi:hypothetical protein
VPLLEAEEGAQGLPAERQLWGSAFVSKVTMRDGLQRCCQRPAEARSAADRRAVPPLSPPRLSTHVVGTRADSEQRRDGEANGPAEADRVGRLDTNVVCNAGQEESRVGAVDDGRGRAVELGDEDQEEGKGRVLGEVAGGADSALQRRLVLLVGRRLLVRGVADLCDDARSASASACKCAGASACKWVAAERALHMVSGAAQTCV